MKVSIPVSTPVITEADKLRVLAALEDGWISGDGPIIEEFEGTVAKACRQNFGVAVCNGSVALDLAVHILELPPGSEVIVPSFTIISVIAQVLRAGLRPVFVDVDPTTWNASLEEIEAAITKKTRAIIAVHTYGLSVDAQGVRALADAYDLLLIEDAAEAHGLMCRDEICGSFGDVATFSFYANKNVTSGEGGMVLTRSAELAERLRYFRNLCFEPTRRFVHNDLGWNSRMSSLQSALALSQWERLEETIERRRQIGTIYNELLGDVHDVQLPPDTTDLGRNDYWVYGMVLKGKFSGRASEVRQNLAEVGVGTRPFFFPLHQQPVLKKYGFKLQRSLPVSENLGISGFYIPNGLGITPAQQEYVVTQIRSLVK